MRDREEKDDTLKVLWFNAWQYERLDPVLALLQMIANKYGNDKAQKLNDIIKGLGLVFLDVVSRKTIGLSLNEIKKHFESSVQQIQTIHETLEKLIGEDKELVVFVDDLDRCSIDNTLNILESIKLVFNANNTKFVVGADMKMLETAWALKHRPLAESPNEGRDHLEKIFQLKLSLPSKAFTPLKETATGFEGLSLNENNLIKSYLENLSPELSPEVKHFIASAFPPNPRKIKRAMSLAYFIGNNLGEMSDDEFEKTFPFVLFLSVATTYFSDLAALLKNAPGFLEDVMSLIRGSYNMKYLTYMVDNAGYDPSTHERRAVPIEDPSDKTKLAWEKLLQNPRLVKFANDSIVGNRLMFRFLKASLEFFDKVTRIEEEAIRLSIYEDQMRKVIEEAGLIY